MIISFEKARHVQAARHFRGRAHEFRCAAMDIDHPDLREGALALAQTYERLATVLESGAAQL